MHTQRTRRRVAQEQRLTHYDELGVRSTMSRLHRQARAIADELEHSP